MLRGLLYTQGSQHDGLLRPVAQHAQPVRRHVRQLLRRSSGRNTVRRRHHVAHLQVPISTVSADSPLHGFRFLVRGFPI